VFVTLKLTNVQNVHHHPQYIVDNYVLQSGMLLAIVSAGIAVQPFCFTLDSGI
jgi:hypothetical protein